VDISSTSLAARIGRSGAQGSFANTSEGIASLAAFCRHHHVEVVAMEATGGYEQRPFAQLWEQGLPVALLNPRAVRSFAQAMGLLEKTDAIDAGVIAWFAEARNSLPNQPAAANQLRLRGLVTRLRQLTAIRTAQRNQSRLITDPTAPASPQPVNRPRSSASLSPISCSSASTQKPEMSAVNSWQHHNS
jgi:transposase